MFVFGHLGIGDTLAAPWRERLPRLALFSGMLLPDVIDKPLYYARVSPDFFSCTRTVGHTILLTAIALGVGAFRRSKMLTAIGLGMATHLVLDCALDAMAGTDNSALVAALWPLMGHFMDVYSASLRLHLTHVVEFRILIWEVVGLGLLGWRMRARIRT
jgi:hypothetical protein